MATDQATKAARFRALHEGPGAFVVPNPWDIGTARILAGLGFQALATTSAGLAFSLGLRDGEGAVTRDLALEHSTTIVAATDLPVSADLENGFGHSPEEVAETIRRAAAIGLVGGSIEDATGDADQPIYEFNHAVERVAAAVETARGLEIPFTFTARAENYLHGRPDLDDTLRRLKAFEEAGADVLYAPGLRDIETIRTVCQSVSKPVNVVMGLSGGTFTVDQLAEAGVRRISLGSALARTALGAFLNASREISEQGTFGFADGAATFNDLAPYLKGADS